MSNFLKIFLFMILLLSVANFSAESKLKESTDSSQHYRCEIIIKYMYLNELSIEFGNALLTENYSNIFLASEDLVETLDGMKRELESKEDFIERVKEWTGGVGADVVIENLADDVLAKSIDAAKFMGVIGAFGFAAGPEVKFDIRNLFFAQKKLLGSMASNIENLQFGLEQVKAGKIKPLLDRAIPLKNAYEAHRLIADNEVSGNIVLLSWVN